MPFRPTRPAVREALLLLGALCLCPLAALLASSDAAAPIARAHALMDLERSLGIFVEPSAQAWLLRHPVLLDAAKAFYLIAHVAVGGWALIWTWCLRRDRYPVVRNAFLLVQAALITCYVVVPTAPPRLVPGAGFTDVLGNQGLAASAHLLQSPFAAVPSGHVAFALVAGATLARLGDMAWIRVFGWCYPPLVLAVVVGTGHHLLADAAAASVLVALAGALALALERRGAASATPRPRPALLARARQAAEVDGLGRA